MHYLYRTGFGKTAQERLDETNKGHQLLKKMGWGGAGLGSKEQGIDTPISGGDVSKTTIDKCFIMNIINYFYYHLFDKLVIIIVYKLY